MNARVRMLALIVACTVTAGLPGQHEPAPRTAGKADGPGGGQAGRHALLVGVSKYPHLANEFKLEGPANDVVLLRKLLVDQFHFRDEQIKTLAEAAGGEDSRPTFANIQREFDDLAKKVKPGDQVVILLSGHGLQIPDQDPPQLDDPEPDGKDEAFLPADTKPWAPDKLTIPNAIRDDDLRRWLRPITQEKEAYVWLIADCCHSGTILRAGGLEVPRKVNPEKLGIPRTEFEASTVRCLKAFGRTRGGDRDTSPFIKGEDGSDKLVGYYACLSNEETVELPLPEDGRDAKYHGLLTYTLCEAFSQSRAAQTPTYRELLRRIDDRYKSWGRTFPTPLVVGKGADRQVLGLDGWRSPTFRLTAHKSGWALDGGRLHGLTEGTILAVHRPEGEAGKPVGHVRISSVRTLAADVEPCDHDGQPTAAKDLPDKGRCEPVRIDYGDLKLKVGVAGRTVDGKPVPEDVQERWWRELEMAGREKSAVIVPARPPRLAEWLVVADGADVYLVRAAGEDPHDRATTRFGPYRGAGQQATVKERLARIARARHLIGLAQSPQRELVRGAEGHRKKSVDVEVEIVRFKDEAEARKWNGGNHQVGEPISRNTTLHPETWFAARLHNRGKVAVYATVLFVDAGCGIKCCYPAEEDVVERLLPGRLVPTVPFRLKDDALGLEHIVVLAVRAVGNPVDFSRLEQASLAKARSVQLRGEEDGLDTPLGRLLQRAMYGEGDVRSAERAFVDDYATDRFSWYTLPRVVGADQKP